MNFPDAVLLLAHGGPSSVKEIRPFIEQIFAGIPAGFDAIDPIVDQYIAIGGKSPFLERTEIQRQALIRSLRERRLNIPVVSGMRYGTPSIPHAVKDLVQRGARDVAAIIFSPYQCPFSWDVYLRLVQEAQTALPGSELNVRFPEPWNEAPAFVNAVAVRVTECFIDIGLVDDESTHVLFTAHAIPSRMADQSPYVDQFNATCKAIAGRLGLLDTRWSPVFQSRPADARGRWTEPGLEATMGHLAERGIETVVLVPTGFLCDHKEVLFDLDSEARKYAGMLGLRFARAQTVEDHPQFIELLADLACRATIF